MRVSINLASKPFADFGPLQRQLRILMGVLVALILALLLGLHFFHAAAEKARAKERSVDAQIAKVRAERQGYEAMMAEPTNKRVLNQAKTLNALFAEKNFSWTLSMEDLERVLPGGVQVTTLEPDRDPKTGDIIVKLRVLGPRDKSIDLVKNLEHSKRFMDARIVGESLDTGNNQNQQAIPVTASTKANFDLLAQYVLPTDDEMKAIAQKQKKDEATSTAVSQPVAPSRPMPQAQQSVQPQRGRMRGSNDLPVPGDGSPGHQHLLRPGASPNRTAPQPMPFGTMQGGHNSTPAQTSPGVRP